VFDFAAKAIMAGKDPKEEAKRVGFKPNLKKRGHVRSAFDGRPQRFDRSRLTLQVERHRALRPREGSGRDDQPRAGPRGQRRAAREDERQARGGHQGEIGKDDGRELPDLPNVTWGLDRVDLWVCSGCSMMVISQAPLVRCK